MNEQLSLFNYDKLDSGIRNSFKQRAERINERSRRIGLDIWENGREFCEAQQELAKHGYGCFVEWAETETGYKKSSVYRMIDVYNHIDFPNLGKTNFAPSALYILAAPSTPDEARHEAIERAQAGETITYTQAKEIVAEHKTTDTKADYNGNNRGFTRVDRDENTGIWHVGGLPYVETIEATSASQETYITMFSHDSVEWYTPAEIIELARGLMGQIDIDPATSDAAQKTVMAKSYFTEADNGLTREWHGRVWLNPPYSKTSGRSNQEIWAEKLQLEYQAGNVTEALLLVRSALGYKWFEAIWDKWPVCFVKDRLNFIRNGDEGENGESKQGTAIFYLGNNLNGFIETFIQIGRITTPDGRYITRQ